MAALLSGQITVTTAGTEVQGPTTPGQGTYAIKAHPDNTDTVWVGNDGNGAVSSSNGFPLDAGEGYIFSGLLSDLWFDADVNGHKFCWFKLV